MKDIIDICKDFGIEIPAEKHAEFRKGVAENYKTIAEHEKKVNRLTDDLNAANQRADAAEETLKGFEGKDFDAIIRERDEWKRKHDEAVATHQKEQEDREFNEILTTAISEAKGRNPKAITALLDMDKLRGSRNQQSDIKAALDALRTESGYLFEDNGGAPYFTQGNPGGGPVPGKTYTMGEVMKMKNENPGLDIKQFLNFGGKE